MQPSPLVSVLMTAYNREKYIAEAIESVLASTYTNFELIIVDDCSKDNTVAIARSYEAKDSRVKVYVNENNMGDYPNRNNAASYAKGKYLKYLDSDDLLYKHSLQVFIDFMESNPYVALGISSSATSTIQPFPIIFTPKQSVRHHFFKNHFLDCAPSGTIIKHEVFKALGGFSGKRMVGDIEFGLYCASQYNVMLLPPGLIFWREHGNQEVFIGIDNNMYAPMMKEVLNNFFNQVTSNILTIEEKEKILKKSKHSFFSNWLKKCIKKIVN
jgi:glycosyltransferase involved in cell wall biosynthesis